jgi:hypothetical protein
MVNAAWERHAGWPRIPVHRQTRGGVREAQPIFTYLAQLEKLVGVAMTTRRWSTVEAIARVLADAES